MENNKKSLYSTDVRERILLILQYSDLTLLGLSEISKVSESHLYAVLNGRKRLTGLIADKICSPFKLQGWQLLTLDYDIPPGINKSSELALFKKEYKGNGEYFSETKNASKASFFIRYIFVNNPIFENPVHIQDAIAELHKLGKNYKSKELSQILHYLVKKNLLASKKGRMKLKNGSLGVRIVDVFFKNDC